MFIFKASLTGALLLLAGAMSILITLVVFSRIYDLEIGFNAGSLVLFKGWFSCLMLYLAFFRISFLFSMISSLVISFLLSLTLLSSLPLFNLYSNVSLFFLLSSLIVLNPLVFEKSIAHDSFKVPPQGSSSMVEAFIELSGITMLCLKDESRLR